MSDSSDLTPEVLARWEELAAKVAAMWASEKQQPDLLAVTKESQRHVPALLSGVRSRDARIAELEAERDDESARANTAVLAYMRSNERVSELLTEVAARDAVINGAPHDYWCRTWAFAACDCWKSAAPSSVLAGRDAEKWDEGALWAYEEITGEKPGHFLAPGDNPYREEATE